MEAYLRNLEQTLRLDPEETRAIVAEVRGNLEDLIAHLKGQGYSPDEAEREALRRFDDAKGLATALRRAHRRAPLTLQMLGLVLLMVGVGGLLLGFEALQAAVTVGIHPGTTTLYDSVTPVATRIAYSLPWTNYRLIEGISLLLLSIPGLVILAGALASLWVTKAVVLRQRRPRWHRVGAGMGVAALCDVVLALTLLSVMGGVSPRPQSIPYGKQLAAAGLCFRPTPGQPTGPVVADLLCADRTATYVRYHIPDPTLGEPLPILADARNPSSYGDAAYPLVSCTPCPAYSGPSHGQGLRQIMPWRTGEQGLAVFAMLDARVHEAALIFDREIVHIPIDLGPWNRVLGGTHPFISMSKGGVTINLLRVLRGVSSTLVDYTIDASRVLIPRGGVMAHPQFALSDAHGRIYQQVTSPYSDGCRPVARGGGHCAPEALFAPAPRGARLSLTIQSFAVYPYIGARGHSVTGPWRIPFVMP